jgi:hypothetical protein
MTAFRKLHGMLLGSSNFDMGDPKNARSRSTKRSTWQQLVVAACLVLLTAPTTRAQKINKVTAVRMEDDPDHKMVGVSCQINAGRRRYVCVIDSGATNTIVSDRLLKAEGPLIEMTTGNGVVRVHQREVSLTIADGLQVKSKAFVQSRMLPGIDILVGQDVLRQFRSVIFDYETRQVEFQR